MRRNRICARLIAALLLAVLPVFLFAGCGSKDPVLATYKDAEITRSLVDYQKQTMRHLNGAAEVSDKEAVDELLINNIMLDEAETRGLSVSQEEIDAMLQSQHDNYENYEEIRAIIDDYCKEQDLTTEQYFAVLEEQVPRSILRQKLRDALGQEYCRRARAGIHQGQSPAGNDGLRGRISGWTAGHIQRLYHLQHRLTQNTRLANASRVLFMQSHQNKISEKYRTFPSFAQHFMWTASAIFCASTQ